MTFLLLLLWSNLFFKLNKYKIILTSHLRISNEISRLYVWPLCWMVSNPRRATIRFHQGQISNRSIRSQKIDFRCCQINSKATWIFWILQRSLEFVFRFRLHNRSWICSLRIHKKNSSQFQKQKQTVIDLQRQFFIDSRHRFSGRHRRPIGKFDSLFNRVRKDPKADSQPLQQRFIVFAV